MHWSETIFSRKALSRRRHIVASPAYDRDQISAWQFFFSISLGVVVLIVGLNLPLFAGGLVRVDALHEIGPNRYEAALRTRPPAEVNKAEILFVDGVFVKSRQIESLDASETLKFTLVESTSSVPRLCTSKNWCAIRFPIAGATLWSKIADKAMGTNHGSR